VHLKEYLIPQKQVKLLYYFSSLLRELLPWSYSRRRLNAKLSTLSNSDREHLQYRLNYYNKLTIPSVLSANAQKLKDFKMPGRHTVYYFDFMEYARYFNPDFQSNLLSLDVTQVPDEPSITKSRPVKEDNANSVLLKLNKIRHFNFVKYDIPYLSKKDMLFWRGNSGQPARLKFLLMYFKHPMCDLGFVNKTAGYADLEKEKVSINRHLKHKFVLCIEGNDVATNLKWVMSSNSVAVCSIPKYETWFMEGTLIPDHHFIAIRDDFADLEEKLNYYITNPEKAQQIIYNAHQHVAQFKDKYREDLLSILVMEKYFVCTGQLDPISDLLKAIHLSADRQA